MARKFKKNYLRKVDILSWWFRRENSYEFNRIEHLNFRAKIQKCDECSSLRSLIMKYIFIPFFLDGCQWPTESPQENVVCCLDNH